jgi:hypothetical protein
VTWIVRDLNHAQTGWEALGLSDVREYPKVKFTGKFRGKPVTITAAELTGRFGNLTVDMIQPTKGENNAFTDFLSKHGDGIFSIVYQASTEKELNQEIQRMRSLGVDVLQQVTVKQHGTPTTFTYLDTQPQGKFSIGLVYQPNGHPQEQPDGSTSPEGKQVVTHLGIVVRQIQPVSAYWQKLGFPAIPVEHATPRKDMQYRDKPLWFYFDVGFQRLNPSFALEWIAAPPSPPNIYNDYLKLHGEGIQHIGMTVEDLPKTVGAYERLGYHVWQAGAWGNVGEKNSGQYKYMDTDSVGGISVELIHAY